MSNRTPQPGDLVVVTLNGERSLLPLVLVSLGSVVHTFTSVGAGTPVTVPAARATVTVVS